MTTPTPTPVEQIAQAADATIAAIDRALQALENLAALREAQAAE